MHIVKAGETLSSIARAHYRLTDVHSQIDAYVVDSVRAAVPTIELDEVYEAKGAISERVRRALAEAMEPFGYAVLASPVTDVRIDDDGVRGAMARVHVAARLRLAAEDAAEVEKIRTVKAAEAAAASTEILARARSSAAFFQGQGAARRHRAILAGVEQDAAEDAQHYAGPLAWTPITGFSWYVVHAETMAVAGKILPGINGTALNGPPQYPCIVDSGTNGLPVGFLQSPVSD